MFLASIKLRYSHPKVPRAYKIPHPHKGIWIISTLGIVACVFGFLLVFIPPSQIQLGNLFIYEAFLLTGLLVMCGIPLVIHTYKKPSWNLLKSKRE